MTTLAADSPHDIVTLPYTTMEAQLYLNGIALPDTFRRNIDTVFLYNTKTQRILAQFNVVPVTGG